MKQYFNGITALVRKHAKEQHLNTLKFSIENEESIFEVYCNFIYIFIERACHVQHVYQYLLKQKVITMMLYVINLTR